MDSHQDHGQEQEYQYGDNAYSSYVQEHVYNQYVENDYSRYGQEQHVYNQFSGKEHVYHQYGESTSSSYPYGNAPMPGNENPEADFWDNIPSDITSDLKALSEFMKELYMKNQELFKKVFPKFAEKHFMKEFAEGKHFHGMKPKTMARSLSLGSPRGGDSIPRLERFKVRPPVLVVTGETEGK